MLAPNGPFITINFEDINDQRVHEKIRTMWPKYSPAEAYNFTYMSNHYAERYRSDVAQRNAVFVLSGIVLLLSCMGIFGVSAFIAKKSTKEISIRKVLGARVLQLYLHQTRQYLRIVVLAFFLSIAPVYFAVDHWLNRYAYRIELEPINFLFGFSTVMAIILIVITGNTLKISLQNPVNTLKDE